MSARASVKPIYGLEDRPALPHTHILLDNLIPGTPEERGLVPSLLVPEGGDIGVGDEQ